MYKINYKYYSGLNIGFILYIISFFTIISFLSIALPMVAQDEVSVDGVMSDVMETSNESDYNLDDEIPDTDITTKIYRSADLSTESLDKGESELDPAIDADVIDKNELIRTSKSMIYLFSKDGKQVNSKLLNKPSNLLLPWILLFVILTIIFVVLMISKKIKI